MNQSRPKLEPTTDPKEPDFERLLEAVYDELRRIAHFHRKQERSNLTLQTTALVHEAYIRLANSHTVPRPRDEPHMKALTSRIIRRVLVDHARKVNAKKRDQGVVHADPADEDLIDRNLSIDVLDLDAALNRLAHVSKRLERTVELKFFGGLTSNEVALELDVSLRTAERDWQTARLYLLELLQAPPESG